MYHPSWMKLTYLLAEEVILAHSTAGPLDVSEINCHLPDENEDPSAVDIAAIIRTIELSEKLQWKFDSATITKTPLTPPSEEEWDKSSTCEEITRKRPKILLKIRPRLKKDKENDQGPENAKIPRVVPEIRQKPAKFPENELDFQKLTDELLRGSKALNDLNLKELCALIEDLSSDKYWEQSLYLSTIELIKTGSPDRTLYSCFSVISLIGYDSHPEVKVAVNSIIVEIAHALIEASKSGALHYPFLSLGLRKLTKIIETVDILDTDLLALSSKITMAFQEGQFSNQLTGAILSLLVSCSLSANIVSEYMYESCLAFIEQDTTNASKVQIGRYSIFWKHFYLILDITCRLLKIANNDQDEGVASSRKAFLNCYGLLDPLFSFDDLDVASNKLEFIGALSMDILSLVDSDATWIVGIFMLSHCLSSLLKRSLFKEFRVDLKVRLLDTCGIIAEGLRAIELDSNKKLHILFENLANLEGSNNFFNHLKLSNVLQVLLFSDATDARDRVSLTSPNTEKLLALLLQCLNDPGSSIRCKAIREFARVLKPSDPLLANDNFVLSIRRKIDDPSPSVREAALDFFVSSLKLGAHKEYFSVVLSKIGDSSIAVKKRAIKLISSVLPDLPPEEATEVRSVLVHDAALEVDFQSNPSYKALIDNWIIPMMNHLGLLEDSHSDTDKRQTLAIFTADLIKIIRSPRCQPSAIQCFFEQVRNDRSMSEKFEKLRCQALDLLFDTLVATVEAGPPEAAKYILSALVILIGHETANLDKHFRLISVLVLSEDCDAVLDSLKLIKVGLCGEDPFIYRQVPNLCSDLLKLTMRGSESIVKLSLNCLFVIAQSNLAIKNQIQKLYLKMKNFITVKSKDTKNGDPLLYRALYSCCVISRFGRQFNFDWDLNICDAAGLIEILEFHNEQTCAIFKSMSLCELMIGDPLESLKPPLCTLIKTAFSSKQDSSIGILLRGFLEMITLNESINQISKFSDGINGTLDYSTSLCTVLQSFLLEIIDASKSTSSSVVEGAALLMSLMIKHGLTHPQRLIPHLFCLWRNPWPKVSSKLDRLCLEVLETQESYVRICMGEIVHLSYEWVLSRGTEPLGIIINDEDESEAYFSPLFNSFETRSKRQEMCAVIIKEIERYQNDERYVRFLSESLAEFRYKTLEEVAFVLKRLSDLIVIVDNDVNSSRSKSLVMILLLRLKYLISNHYRLTLEQADFICSNKAGKRDRVCRRMSEGPTNLVGPTCIFTLSDPELMQIIEDLLIAGTSSNVGIAPSVEAQQTAVKLKQTQRRRKKSRKKIVYCESDGSVEDD